jgi:hypothetical protein
MTLEKVVNQWIRDRLENTRLFLATVRRGRKWSLTIDEIVEGEDHYNSTKWTDAINWTVTTLGTWPNCTRMSYDTWDFQHKRDAEKFTTLFQLKWAE